MSSLITSNISDGTTSVPTGYVVNGSAKAWVRLNGQGTITAVESFNVSSIADGGVGIYQGNFISSMATPTYPAFQSQRESGGVMYNANNANATTSMLVYCYNSAGALVDPQAVSFGPVGNLA